MWKTVNKFHPNLICKLNLNTFYFLVNKGDLIFKLNVEEILCDLFFIRNQGLIIFLNSSSSSITYILQNNIWLIYFWHNV